MTSPLEAELADFIAGIKGADEQDAPFLIELARQLRADPEMRYEKRAEALESMAKRMGQRFKAATRLEERGLLEQTSSLSIADLDDDN